MIEFGKEMVRDEARALDALADSLGDDFDRACRLILETKGKLIVSGLGKSGHIGRKIAATFASTGTTATFLHLAEAIHGDLGIADRGDVALLISQSGQTAELQPVIDHFDAVVAARSTPLKLDATRPSGLSRDQPAKGQSIRGQ